MIRKTFLVAIIAAGAALIFCFYENKPTAPFEYTFTPAYEFFGRPVKTADRTLTKIMPVRDIDEKVYGEAIASRCGHLIKNSSEQAYLDDLMSHIAVYAKKGFQYRVYLMDSSLPNAFAMPGGNIFITRGLLQIIRSEAELVSVLGHEMGHIELSHTMDAIRFELLARKVNAAALGKVADFTMRFFTRHSFSKTQENEADAYAYSLLLNTQYNPSAMGAAFEGVLNYYKNLHNTTAKTVQPVNEYFQTHPYLELRKEAYIEQAIQWWASHPEEKRYRGMANLQNRTSFYKSAISSEWVIGVKN